MEQHEMVQELHYLGLDEADCRLLLLTPLLQVAWADAQVVQREEVILRSAARQLGLLDGDGVVQFESWLLKRPSDEYLRRSRAALVELTTHSRGLGSDVTPADIRYVLSMLGAVAEAGSGLLGFFRYESRSKAMVTEIREDLFSIASGELGGLDWEDEHTDLTAEDMLSEDLSEFDTAELATEEVVPGFLPGENGIVGGLDGFLQPEPTPELLEAVRQSDLKGELSEPEVLAVAQLRLRGEELPGFCRTQAVGLYRRLLAMLILDPKTLELLHQPEALEAVEQVGQDMVLSINHGGSFSSSAVLGDKVVLRMTAVCRALDKLEAVYEADGGYLLQLDRLSAPEGLLQHFGVARPLECSHFVHLCLCHQPEQGFTLAPVVLPLGTTPGGIVLAPELLSEREKALIASGGWVPGAFAEE